MYNNSDVGFKKAKHTAVARRTSVMRKLDNELEKEKQRVKVVDKDK